MISCGEPSGDLYAGALAVRDPASSSPTPTSPASAASGCARPARRWSRDFQRPVGHRPDRSAARASRARGRPTGALVRAAEAEPPDVFVPIDFPDFNFVPGARAARARHPGRLLHQPAAVGLAAAAGMKTMKRVVDRVLVIFPFEAAFYEEAGVPVTFVGHPLLELTRAAGAARAVPARATASIRRSRSSRSCRAAAATSCARSCRIWSAPPALIAARRAGRAVRDRRARRTCDDALFAPLADWPAGARRPVVVERADRRRAGERRRRARRLGHRHGAGGAARLPDGRRLSRRRR